MGEKGIPEGERKSDHMQLRGELGKQHNKVTPWPLIIELCCSCPLIHMLFTSNAFLKK